MLDGNQIFIKKLNSFNFLLFNVKITFQILLKVKGLETDEIKKKNKTNLTTFLVSSLDFFFVYNNFEI